MDRMENKRELVHSDISEIIIGCCFEVMADLGVGFLENVYKNALFIAMKQKGLNVSAEQSFEVMFRSHKIGKYIADLVVENAIIVELNPSLQDVCGRFAQSFGVQRVISRVKYRTGYYTQNITRWTPKSCTTRQQNLVNSG